MIYFFWITSIYGCTMKFVQHFLEGCTCWVIIIFYFISDKCTTVLSFRKSNSVEKSNIKYCSTNFLLHRHKDRKQTQKLHLRNYGGRLNLCRINMDSFHSGSIFHHLSILFKNCLSSWLWSVKYLYRFDIQKVCCELSFVIRMLGFKV